MADTKEEPKAKTNGKFVVNIDHWKTKQVRAYARFGTAGNLDGQIGMAQAVITEWPYAGDPGNDEDWDELHPSEMKAALRAVVEEAAQFFR